MKEVHSEYRKFLLEFFIKQVKIPSLAEDLAHDVFVKFWKKRNQIQSVEDLDAWLFTIARNHLRDHYRRLATEKNYQAMVWQDIELQSNSVIKEIYKMELEEEIRALVASLPPRQKQVYELSRSSGMTLQEIAEKLEISPNTVKNHLVQALKVLRAGINLT